jgi:hypothetical protein
VLLTAGLAASVLPQAPEAGFERVLWLHGGPPRDDRFFAMVKELGFTAVSVSGDEDPAVPGRHGLRFYRDQIAGKGILELREAEWAKVRDGYLAARDPVVLVRPAVLADQAAVDSLLAVIGRNLDAALGHQPIWISLGDEISVTRHCNPLDLCFAGPSLLAFREFLRSKHENLAALNRAWGISHPSFEAVRPWTADQIRARELGTASLPRNLRPWAEHREFMDAELARVVTRGLEAVRERSKVPCGLTGLQPPSAYGGHDYARLLPNLTFYESYDIGGARDLARSLAPPGARAVGTLFPPKAGESPLLLRAALYDLLCHGAAGAIVWSAGDVLGEAGPTPFGRVLAETFAQLGDAAAAFAGAEIQRAPLWIVESQASVRAHWMLDSAGDGATWIRRLSSYEATHSTSLATRASWIQACKDLGFEPLLVPAASLAQRLAGAGPRLLVLPACLALADAEAAAIDAWVARGGVVVADYGSGIYDENLVLRPAGALDAVFGIRRRSLLAADLRVREGVAGGPRLPGGAGLAERGLDAEGLFEPAGSERVQLEHEHGKGRAHYLNLALCEYAAARLDPQRIALAFDLRSRLRRVLGDAGLLPPIEVRAEGLPTCLERTFLRARDGRQLLAVRVHALERPELLAQLAARGPRRVTLSFPRPTRVRDLRARTEPVRGASLTLELPVYEALLLELQEAR